MGRRVGRVNFTSTVLNTVLVKTSFLSVLLTIIFPSKNKRISSSALGKFQVTFHKGKC